MATVTKISAGNYLVSDGKVIQKEGSSWYIYDDQGQHIVGPLPTLKSAKAYLATGTVQFSEHNRSTAYGRKQAKKEFNSYLAAEAQNGNYGPIILYSLVIGGFCLLMYLIRGY